MDIARLYTPASLRIRIRLDERIDKGRVAQLGEHRPYKPGVTGSSPVPPTIGLLLVFEKFCVAMKKIGTEWVCEVDS